MLQADFDCDTDRTPVLLLLLLLLLLLRGRKAAVLRFCVLTQKHAFALLGLSQKRHILRKDAKHPQRRIAAVLRFCVLTQKHAFALLGLSQKRHILRKAAQRLQRKIRKSMPLRFWVFPKSAIFCARPRSGCSAKFAISCAAARSADSAGNDCDSDADSDTVRVRVRVRVAVGVQESRGRSGATVRSTPALKSQDLQSTRVPQVSSLEPQDFPVPYFPLAGWPWASYHGGDPRKPGTPGPGRA